MKILCLANIRRPWLASISVGAGLGKPTVHSGREAISRQLRSDSAVSNHTTVEICDKNRKEDRVIGIIVDTTGDLAAVQRTASRWSHGFCASTDEHKKIINSISHVKVWDIVPTNITTGGNETVSVASRMLKRLVRGSRQPTRSILVQLAATRKWALVTFVASSFRDAAYPVLNFTNTILRRIFVLLLCPGTMFAAHQESRIKSLGPSHQNGKQTAPVRHIILVTGTHVRLLERQESQSRTSKR